jgi:hypothetical protein
MTLPSSGPISFSQVNTELGRSSTDEMSLADAEGGAYAPINQNSPDKPDGVAPYSMSEWYDYDHNAAGALTPGLWFDSGASYFDGPSACNSINPPPPDPPPNPTPIFFSGTGGIGDTIYYDDQVTPFLGFNQWAGFELGQGNTAALVDNNGLILDLFQC